MYITECGEGTTCSFYTTGLLSALTFYCRTFSATFHNCNIFSATFLSLALFLLAFCYCSTFSASLLVLYHYHFLYYLFCCKTFSATFHHCNIFSAVFYIIIVTLNIFYFPANVLKVIFILFYISVWRMAPLNDYNVQYACY